VLTSAILVRRFVDRENRNCVRDGLVDLNLGAVIVCLFVVLVVSVAFAAAASNSHA